MPRHGVLAGAPLLIAHRGGSALAPENTLAAFANGLEVWGADMLELDVHASADGHCIVIHDAVVDRTTDGSGPVAAMTLQQLKTLDAGYRFSPDGGATFPFRGADVRVPTLDEVLAAFPSTRIVVEVKTAAAQGPLFDAIRRGAAQQRVVIAGMHDRDRTRFSEYGGAVSASMEGLRRFWVAHRIGLGRFVAPRADVVQVPEWWSGRQIVTPRFVRDLRAHDVPVHVWTVDDEADMRRLLAWGVEGIVTDRPDVLGAVLHRIYGRALAPGHRSGAEPQ